MSIIIMGIKEENKVKEAKTDKVVNRGTKIRAETSKVKEPRTDKVVSRVMRIR